MLPEKIDLVYLWCDGSDPKFAKQKNELLKKLNLPFSEENQGDKRYIQHDELKYSLRSAEMFVPWINKIFIVTNNQVPIWLKDHPKIKIVDHSEIIPQKFLPTFNSCCIECFIHLIPGLSEHFLYSNDDFFFARLLKPEDFFDTEGNPIMVFYPARKLSPEVVKEMLLQNGVGDYFQTLVRAWYFFTNKRAKTIPFLTPSHSIDAYRKSFYASVSETYPEILVRNTKPFRTGGEISRLLYNYEHSFHFECPYLLKRKTNFLERLKARIIPPQNFLSLSRESVYKLKRDIKIFRPGTFCFNNIPPDQDEEAHLFFSELFPVKAPWENEVH